MGPNRTVVFQLESFEEFGGFEHMPKGDLVRFGVNPYTGKVVFSFQERHENGCAVIEAVLNQVQRDLRKLRMQHGTDLDLKDLADFLEGKSEVEMKPLAKRTAVVESRGNARKAG